MSSGNSSVSPSFMYRQRAVGPCGELGAKPELCQTPPEPRGRIVRMAFTQTRQCERARGAVGIDHHGNLPGGRSAAQQFDEHAPLRDVCLQPAFAWVHLTPKAAAWEASRAGGSSTNH